MDEKSRIVRLLDLSAPLARKSVFLFGPRQTGKTTYIDRQITETIAMSLSLLNNAFFHEVSSRPQRLSERIEGLNLRNALVVIDEIQRFPELLNEVHALIESRNIRFLLTGSSARKLKSAGVNLLGGRALSREMLPLTYWELEDDFDMDRCFQRGLLPSHYLSPDVDDDLQSYVGQYLREEIAAEGLVRNLSHFSQFLEMAALCNTKQINFSSLASDVGISRVTVQSYFQIIVDTLIGEFLEPFQKKKRRKTVASPKFFFFDLGVVRFLRRLHLIQEGTNEFGEFFEHLIYHHLRSYISYKNRQSVLSFWRTTQGEEVDFILNDHVAIECKATSSPSAKHLKGLQALASEHSMKHLFLVCRVPEPLKMGDIEVLPYRLFFDRLLAGEFSD